MEAALIGLGVAALAAAAIFLYRKYGKKAEADVKAEEVKLSDFAKNEVKKADEKANDLHDEVKNAEAKVKSDVKKVEDEAKEAVDKVDGKKPGGDILVGGGTGGGGNPGH